MRGLLERASEMKRMDQISDKKFQQELERIEELS
jgi:hypothetical protein